MKPQGGRSEKPLLRGWSHLAAFACSLVAGPLAVAAARPGQPRVLAVVYALSLSGLLGVSSVYHRVHWGEGLLPWIRRLDHSTIFVLIGGSSTPFALALPADEQAGYLAAVWGLCALGTVRAVAWPYAPKWLAAATYLGVGWGIATFVPRMAPLAPEGVMIWVFAGGVTYSLGALCYALKRPNPLPGVFGYHEVFHALVIIAAAMQYVAVRRMLG